LDELLKLLSEWYKTIKDQEGMLQIFGRDPAGNVSEGYFVDDSTEQPLMPFAGLHHTFRFLQWIGGRRTQELPEVL
jgi:hypothetical protein